MDDKEQLEALTTACENLINSRRAFNLDPTNSNIVQYCTDFADMIIQIKTNAREALRQTRIRLSNKIGEETKKVSKQPKWL